MEYRRTDETLNTEARAAAVNGWLRELAAAALDTLGVDGVRAAPYQAAADTIAVAVEMAEIRFSTRHDRHKATHTVYRELLSLTTAEPASSSVP